MRRRLSLPSLALALAAVTCQAAGPPGAAPHSGVSFEHFPAAGVFRGQVPGLKFLSTTQRRFSSQILREATLPANFAGQYRIAEWGCGSSCVSFVVIDLKSGSVFDGPFSTLGYGAPYRYEGGSDELEYRQNSRLLIARGCPEDKNCGTYYYEWDGHAFARLRLVRHGRLPRE